MTDRSFKPETPTIAVMNKPSHLFSFFVVAQLCLVVLVLGLQPVSHSSSYARAVAARTDITNGIKAALNRFSNECTRFPTTTEGIQALLTCRTDISQNLWHGPYLDQIPVDPWGHEYVYRYPGAHNTNGYDLYSTGADGISKTGGADPDDINNWDSKSPHADYSGDNAFFLGGSVLVFIPLTCAVCSLATIFSRGGRKSFSRNRAAYFVWMILSLVAFMIGFLTVRLAG